MLRRLAVTGRAQRRCVRGLEEFFDGSAGADKNSFPAGRSWRASELRLKSFEDLHKLWFVLLKEKNKLLTEKRLAKTMHTFMANPERLRKVKLSMARLKTVATERSKEYQLHKNVEYLRKQAEQELIHERELADIEEIVSKAKLELNMDEILAKYREEVEIPKKKAFEQVRIDYVESMKAKLKEEMDAHPDFDIDNPPPVPDGPYRKTFPKSPRRTTHMGR